MLSVLSLLCCMLHTLKVNITTKDKEKLYEVTPQNTSVNEGKFKEDITTIAECYNIEVGNSVYDVYENNGSTTFTFTTESGYNNGGVTLDLSLLKKHNANNSVLEKGCIEVEFAMALWNYISQRNTPYKVDAIHINFNIVDSIFDRDSSWGAGSRFFVTETEYKELCGNSTSEKTEDADQVRHMAKLWCEGNAYKRNGTKIQPSWN